MSTGGQTFPGQQIASSRRQKRDRYQRLAKICELSSPFRSIESLARCNANRRTIEPLAARRSPLAARRPSPVARRPSLAARRPPPAA
ncbi:hypothetical protein M1L60_44340, partial [Actinoplanes sp. TRM 88003]